MSYKISQWMDIANDYYRGTVLLGNGASIAVSPAFNYSSLLENAIEKQLLSKDIESLFDHFHTTDFEFILRLVWQAFNVNKFLQVLDHRTIQAYKNIKSGLIQAVYNVHPEYRMVENKLPNIFNFLMKFNMLFSLNYDLVVYWAMTYGLRPWSAHLFKDCFIHGEFDGDWTRFRKPYREQTNTLVFYPHGSLALCRDIRGQEYKIQGYGEDGLLNAILAGWDNEELVPLFVSEGTMQQKVTSIHNSHYLSTVYQEVLASKQTALTIFGWGIGKHDWHLLQRMSKAGIRRVAISVFDQNQDYCDHAFRTIKKYLGQVDIDFFHSESPGCWIYDKPEECWF